MISRLNYHGYDELSHLNIIKISIRSLLNTKLPLGELLFTSSCDLETLCFLG